MATQNLIGKIGDALQAGPGGMGAPTSSPTSSKARTSRSQTHAIAGQMVLNMPASMVGGVDKRTAASRSIVLAPDGAHRRFSSLCHPFPHPARIHRMEQTTCCTKGEVWKVIDLFRMMDRRKVNKVNRQDFFDTIKAGEVTAEQFKWVRRSSLLPRFRESAAEVNIEELLVLIWPKATELDRQKMRRWVALREAQAVLRDQNFRGDAGDLRRIYNYLDENGDGSLSVRELLRADILKREEIFELMGSESLDTSITFVEFCSAVQSHFKQYFVKSDVRSKLEQEEQMAGAEDWKNQFKNLMSGKSEM